MLVVGYLHGLGKLTADSALLEKQGALTTEDFSVIRSHIYYTYYLLDGISGMEAIKQWAAFHHEKLNGQGYPFHREAENLSIGAGIMAVADVFAASKEPQPYKAAPPKEKTFSIMNDMVKDGALDGSITNLLLSHYALLSEICVEAGASAEREYQSPHSVFLQQTRERPRTESDTGRPCGFDVKSFPVSAQQAKNAGSPHP